VSTDRDVTRIVRSWLEEGVAALPDRVLDAVLDELPATPQRRASWLARRFPIMNRNIARVGIAAAAVVVLTIIGISLLPGVNTGSPHKTPTPSVPAQQEPLTIPQYAQPGTRLVPGTYRIFGEASEQMLVTLSDGWFANSYARGGGLFRTTDLVDEGTNRVASLDIGTVGSFLADHCPADGTAAQPLDPPIGPTVDDLVAAFRAVPIVTISAPVAITLGGHTGKQIDLTYAGVKGCDYFLLWRTPPVAGEYWTPGIQAGWQTSLRILDVDGLRLVVTTSHRLDAGSDVTRELGQIVNSISFPR
jgi:hypothetical protein